MVIDDLNVEDMAALEAEASASSTPALHRFSELIRDPQSA
jgi:hypothetical protein